MIKKEKIDLLKIMRNYFLKTTSKEYQRMLTGVRIYVSLMGQRKNLFFIYFSLIFATVFYVIIGLSAHYTERAITLSTWYLPIILFFTPMTAMYLLTLYKEYHFELKKGFVIFSRGVLGSIFFILYIIIFAIILAYSPKIENIFLMIGYFFIIVFMCLAVEIQNNLETKSFITYAKEKVNDTLKDEEKNKIPYTKYEQFYFSIYTYYRRKKQ